MDLRSRIWNAAYWAAPSLACLLLYRQGLLTRFFADDLDWLRVVTSVHSTRDLVDVLFGARGPGHVRFFSERLFYLVSFRLFGLNPLPSHLAVLLTQCANLVLLAAIVRRITRSNLAGFLAPLFWLTNAALATAMCWTSIYNQVLCAFFLLLSFWLFLRYLETGRARYNVAQWVTFILGFGALESIVVYPVLACGYVLCAARHRLRQVLPLFIPSVLFALLHLLFIPKVTTGPYALDFSPARLLGTFAHYWMLSLGRPFLPGAGGLNPSWIRAIAILLSAAVVAFLAWQASRRDWRGAYFAAWFVLLLAPVWPLSRHMTPYYLTLPTLGLAMTAAWAVARTEAAGRRQRALAGVMAALYLLVSVPGAASNTHAYYDRSVRISNFVDSVVEYRRQHPAGLIAIRGIPYDVFWDGMFCKPFELYEVSGVYLVPGEQDRLPAPGVPEWQPLVVEFVAAPLLLWNALEAKQAAIFDVSGGGFVDITASYAQEARAWDIEQLARKIVPGLPMFANNLGEGWYAPEGNYRWMAKRASLRVPGPRSPSERLYLGGYCPAAQIANGPVRLSVSAEGRPIGQLLVDVRDAVFIYSVALPKELTGKPLVEVTLEVDRTFRVPPDPRDLGMAFNMFEIR